ncbi:unnamed protein product, partial [Effrenium voratum]
MSDLEPNSFAVSAIGRQSCSKKETCPAFSFGTQSREAAAMKVFVSPKLTKRQLKGLTAPGPIYDIPKMVGSGPAYAFPQEQRPHGGARYPDSSVDLTCATVDSQKVKFDTSAYATFGTEMRMDIKNAEILVTNPNLMLGMESPGAAEYRVQEHSVRLQHPKYSFGPMEEHAAFCKPSPRLSMHNTSTPPSVGPASHRLPGSVGQQPLSARRSSPAWSLSGPRSKPDPDGGPLLDTAPAFSSLGKQVVSTSKTSAKCSFGKSTRDNTSRMAMRFGGSSIPMAAGGPWGRLPIRPNPETRVAAALRACRTEAEAEAALRSEAGVSAADGDLFGEVERLVSRGWWRAAQAAVQQGHQHRFDLTAPVRRAVAGVKQEADELVRWLDPSYAHPAATPMAFQWAQNASAVMLSARFSHKWEAPGANLAVYSTDKGQGHVNKERTEAAVRQLLAVQIRPDGLEAEILAKVQNSRKRFTLNLQLFDEIVVSASAWSVAFHKAAGSMQMSRGAEIPELHFQVRKRWPEQLWPRLSLEGEAGQSGLTCGRSESSYCSSSDSCVTACSQCQGFPVQSQHCTRQLSELQADFTEASFRDEDARAEVVAGQLRWAAREELLHAQAFAVCWAESGRMQPKHLVSWGLQLADPSPWLPVPETSLKGTHLLLVVLDSVPAEDELCAGHVAAAARVTDHWRPLVHKATLLFEDQDPLAAQLRGNASLAFQADATAPSLAWELHWGRLTSTGWDVVEDRSLIATVGAGAEEVTLEVISGDDSVRVPRHATHFLAFAVGEGGFRTDAVAALRFKDWRPPTEMPTSFV